MALICAKVALVPVIFDPSADFAFTVPKALISHSLAFLLAGTLGALYIRFGRNLLTRSGLHIAVLVFFAANAIAAVFAPDFSLALYGTHARMLGLGTIADWAVLYFAVAWLVRTRRDAIGIVVAALSASLVVLAYEVVQLAGRDPFDWPVDAQPLSTIGNRTTLAEYLTVIALGSVAVGASALGLDRAGRIAVFAISALMLAGAVATGTRSTVFGIAAGAALLLTWVWATRTNKRAKVISLVAAGGSVLALAAALAFTPLGVRLTSTLQPPDETSDAGDIVSRLEPSSAGRVVFYKVSLAMIMERPLLGFGPDHFVVGMPRFRSATDAPEFLSSLPASAHSWVADVGTSSGLMGLGAFLVVAGSAVWLTVRSGFQPITLVGATILLTFLGIGLTTVTDVATDWLFWASAGAVAASTSRPPQSVPNLRNKSRPKRAKVPQQAPGSFGRTAAAGVLLAAGAISALAAATAFDASRSVKQGNDLRHAGKLPDAIDRLVRATTLDGGRPEYWHFLGLAYAAAGQWRDARSAFAHARMLAPYDVRNAGDEARADLALSRAGDSAAGPAALALADSAVQIDHNNPYSHFTRAVVRQVLGDLPEADHSVDRALALEPNSSDAARYVTAAQIKIDLGHPSDAIDVARRGLSIVGLTRQSVQLRYELARALVSTGRLTEALSELDQALAISPNQPAEALRSQVRAQLAK
ncbi:MAG: O-antigen ligase family protein [Chloroflexota bacterium]|nr:O-antigen ligase family protein [Chloroflexota bacterium]